MWLFTTDGFFSIVQHHNTRGRTARFLVRARVRSDLERLKLKLGLGEHEIVTLARADYPHRIEITRKELRRFMLYTAETVDYPNFKNAVADRDGDERAYGYHKVWAVVRSLFDSLALNDRSPGRHLDHRR
jgi:hypothetical protein